MVEVEGERGGWVVDRKIKEQGENNLKNET